MHGCAKSGPSLAAHIRPPSALMAIGAPVQPDPAVGSFGLGREPLLEYPIEIGRGDTDAVVLAVQVQLLMVGVAKRFRR